MANKETINALNMLDEAVKELGTQGIGIEYTIQKQPEQKYDVVIKEISYTTITVKGISPTIAKHKALKAISKGDIMRDPSNSVIEIEVWDAQEKE